MHTKAAVENGETAQIIYLLNAWNETSLLTNREKPALELAEKVTLLHESYFDNDFYERLEQEFGEIDFADLIVLNCSNK